MTEIEGNILDLICDEFCGIICHQVNCKGVMGAGLGLQIKNKFPDVYHKYLSYCKSKPQSKLLGETQLIHLLHHVYFANVFGQFDYGKIWRETSYDSVDRALNSLFNQTRTISSDFSFYFPKYMGCGLGGGDWGIYSAIINKYFPDAIIVNFKK